MTFGRKRAYSSQQDLLKDSQNQTSNKLRGRQNSKLSSTNVNVAMSKGISDALGPKAGAIQEHKKESSELQTQAQDDLNEIQIFPDRKTTIIFQFLYNPEYIGVGNPLVINMENLKAFGTITKLIPERIDKDISKETGSNKWASRSARSGGKGSVRKQSLQLKIEDI